MPFCKKEKRVEVQLDVPAANRRRIAARSRDNGQIDIGERDASGLATAA